jgi:hypothetical protein
MIDSTGPVSRLRRKQWLTPHRRFLYGLNQMQSNRHYGHHHHGTSMPADCHGLN